MLTTAAALTVIAIVSADQTPLRAAARDSAAQQAALWQGDSLEIRGEKGDFLQVYDHRRERAGYVRASQVRVQSLKSEAAPELLSVVRFLRDTPGAEALGIGYAAAYLRAAPAEAIDGEAFDALGSMAERLAQRANANGNTNVSVIGGAAAKPGTAGAATAAHLEVAAAYGVEMVSFERDGQVRLCYNGDAQRRVLALPASPVQKARAALALTRHDCVAPNLTPVERYALDQWRAEILDKVDPAQLPAVLKNRLRLRKAGVWAGLAYQRARRPELGAQPVQEAASRALDALAAIDKSELMETDAAAYNDAAIRVGASRWALEPMSVAPAAGKTPAKLSVATTPGQPGETCIHLLDAKHDVQHPLLTRCTYGIVWTASAAGNAQGHALALAVQPTESWREMWVFRQQAEGWRVDVVPPALDNPSLGYVEFAGWVPGKAEMLAVREARRDGRYKRSFEVLNLETLEIKKQADKVGSLSTFYRWQNPLWKAKTIALR